MGPLYSMGPKLAEKEYQSLQVDFIYFEYLYPAFLLSGKQTSRKDAKRGGGRSIKIPLYILRYPHKTKVKKQQIKNSRQIK